MSTTSYHAIHGAGGMVVAAGDEGRLVHLFAPGYAPLVKRAPPGEALHGVWVHDQRCAWAVGDEGTVLRWDGILWHQVALARRCDELNCVFGTGPTDIWFGGQKGLFRYREGLGRHLFADQIVVAIWGTGPDDIHCLCTRCLLRHWDGTGWHETALPAGPDDEYYAISGSPDGRSVWIAGAGPPLSRDGQGWRRIGLGRADPLTGVICPEPGTAWFTSTAGELLRLDGDRLRTVAASPLGWLGGLCAIDGQIFCAGAGTLLRHRT
jgi:hypothetical protein